MNQLHYEPPSKTLILCLPYKVIPIYREEVAMPPVKEMNPILTVVQHDNVKLLANYSYMCMDVTIKLMFLYSALCVCVCMCLCCVCEHQVTR